LSENDLPRFVYSSSPDDRDANGHAHWSAWAEHELRACAQNGDSLAEIAIFICRTEHEVAEKAKKMGLAFQK
jgi:hypothetical protein